MKKMGLKELIEYAEQRGVKFSCGHWDSFEQFMDYFEAHYVSILEELMEKWKNDERGAKRFFAHDILEFFGIGEKELQQED